MDNSKYVTELGTKLVYATNILVDECLHIIHFFTTTYNKSIEFIYTRLFYT